LKPYWPDVHLEGKGKKRKSLMERKNHRKKQKQAAPKSINSQLEERVGTL